MQNVTAPVAGVVRESQPRSDGRAAIALAARAIGPAASRGATALLRAIADASAMALVTPPRDDRR